MMVECMGFLCDREGAPRIVSTMARAGTLPDCLYQKDIQVSEKNSLPSTANGSVTEDIQHQGEQGSTVEDEVTWFVLSSDGESCAGEEGNSENLQITQDVDFS